MKFPLTANLVRLISKRRPQNEAAATTEEKQDRQAFDRLVAGYDDLNARMDMLIAKAKASGDWLCYLPRAAGSPELIERACSYLEKMRTRLEAEGCRVWLCANHDCITRVFEINEFRAIDGCVFCSGEWTDAGRKSRSTFKGVSIDNIALAGDLDLLTQITTPAGCLTMDDMPAHVRAAAQLPTVRGLAGAACFEPMTPALGVTGIYRFAHDKMI